jgi:hypothetical protein
MPNPNSNYDNVRMAGPDGLRIPTEIQRATFDVIKELDLGTIGASPYNLTTDQAGASVITANPTVALTMVLPTVNPGDFFLVKNLNATNAITVEVNGNATNTAIVPVSTTGLIVNDGLTGGLHLIVAA